MDQTLNVKCESECVDREQQTAQQVVQMGEIEHIKCEPELFEDETPIAEHEAQFPFIKCESEWSMESKEEIDDGEVNSSVNQFQISPSLQPSSTEDQESEQSSSYFDCDMSFDSWKTLGDHSKLVHNKLPCKECGKTFLQQSNLYEHLKVDTEVRPYCCNMCKRTFARKKDLSNHQRWFKFPRGLFECLHCGQICCTPTNLRQHLTTHKRKRTYQCKICAKCFLRKHVLIRHMFIHTLMKNYHCQTCQQNFRRKSELGKHEFVHSETSIKCSLCPRMFARPADLRTHMQVHFHDRPLVCLLVAKVLPENFL